MHFVTCPKQGLEMEAVVLNRVGLPRRRSYEVDVLSLVTRSWEGTRDKPKNVCLGG